MISEKRQRENTLRMQTIIGAQENLLLLSSEEEDKNDENDENDENNNRDEEEDVHEAIVLSTLHKRVKENQVLYN